MESGGWQKISLPCQKISGSDFRIRFLVAGGFALTTCEAWSVVQTHPNAASIAVKNLVRQNYQVYNPVFSERIRGGYRRVQLFTNYVFVQAVDQWRAIRSTRGVKDFLFGASDQPARLSNEIILSLRSRENANGCVVLPKVGKFRIGQEVSIKPVHGGEWLRGIYDGQSAQDRAYVLLSLFGAQRRVELKEADLAAA